MVKKIMSDKIDNKEYKYKVEKKTKTEKSTVV